MKNLFTLDKIVEMLRNYGFMVRYPKGLEYQDKSKHLEKRHKAQEPHLKLIN